MANTLYRKDQMRPEKWLGGEKRTDALTTLVKVNIRLRRGFVKWIQDRTREYGTTKEREYQQTFETGMVALEAALKKRKGAGRG